MSRPPGANRRSRRRSNPLLALLRVLAVAGWSGLMYVAYLAWRSFQSRSERLKVTPDWVRFWAQTMIRLIGIKVRRQGKKPARGNLLCPNHLGYLDVLVLAAAFPCYFVSRADAADWPLIGSLIRASEQVLVSRRRSRDLEQSSVLIRERLREGQSVCVFLEGTSTGGDRLLRFLPALLQPAIDHGAPAAPVGLNWEISLPGTTVAADVAYWGGHRFVFHVWRLLGLRGIGVTIRWGDPLPTAGRDRKELASELHRRVRQLVLQQ